MFTNLMRSELSRLRYRRRAWGSVILVILAGVFLPASWADQIRQPGSQEILLAQVDLVRMQATGECPDCTLDNVVYFLTFDEAVVTVLPQAALVLAFIAFMIVVTYVGADFTSGALATQLTFTPQRGILLAARTLACGVLGAVLTLVGIGTTVASMVVSYMAVNGIGSIGPAHGLLELIASTMFYGFIVGLIAALVTFTIRSTPLSMAAAVAVLVVNLLIDDMVVAGRDAWIYHLLPLRNAIAMIYGRSDLTDPFTDGPNFGVVTRGESLIFHLCVIAVLAVVAGLVFERRDVKG